MYSRSFLLIYCIFFLGLAFLNAQTTETFRDNFSSAAYSNNNGTLNFSGNWIETNDTNGATGGRIDINSSQLRFTDLDNSYITRTLNLAGANSVVLRLDYNRTNGDETVAVQLYNGTTYNTVAVLNGTGSVTYTLNPNEISSASGIRFITNSGNWSGGETLFVDNVRFTAEYQPIIAAADITLNESAGTAVFTIFHQGASATGPFTVNYVLTQGTATAGADYTSVSGTLNFNGTTGDSEQVVVPIANDVLFEGDETFTLSFTGTSNPGVDITDTAMATIVDDDALVMTNGGSVTSCDDIFLDPGGVSNYGNNLNVTYTICPDTPNNYVSVDFSIFDVASNDILYIYDGNSTAGALIGQYNNSNVPDIIEPLNPTGCLTFRFVTNGVTTGSGWEATLSCFLEGPKVVVENISFDENVGNAVFTVTQTRARHGFSTFLGFITVPFTVNYNIIDGTAQAGSDYTAVSGTLNFNGQIGSTRTISVPIANDGIPESAENFTVIFTGFNAQYATINISDTGTGTINSQILANDPLTLFQEFDGYFDYSTTGGTLRTGANGVSPCTITTSSSNTLVSPIPVTATVSKAFLYWAHSNTVRDATITFEGQSVSANFLYQTTLTNREFYGYVSDVTSIILAIPNPSTNTYDFSDLNIDNTGNYCSTSTVLGGWTLIIFYEDPNLPAVNINLYQGFDGLSNEGTSFTLDSFYAIAGSGAKATFLSWEGDPDLNGSSSGSTNPEELSITNQGGTTFVLTGDGGQTGNNSYNSTLYDNTVLPIYNNSVIYGVDLDTYDISSFISPADSQVTANVDVGQDFVISAAVVIKVPSNLISGTVFEDSAYPGGAGRNQVASGGLGVSGAIVELFDSAGDFIERNNTDVNGDYSFGGMADGDYWIKVVNNTVKSNRTGGLNCSDCFPVQTYRSHGSAASITPVTTQVGGADPKAFQDAALGIFSGAQSLSAVTVSGNGVVGIDFGFNFNTIVNTNEYGQGSLEQFITNANNLDESTLDIENNGLFNPAPGDDVSIFMIPPAGDPLGRLPDTRYISGYFDIYISDIRSLTPLIAGQTIIDGRTQTAYSGNSNAGTLGAGGSVVGISGSVLPAYDRPEIQLHRDAGNVIRSQGNGNTIRNISIFGGGNSGIISQNGALTISNNFMGVNAQGINSGNLLYGIEVLGGTLVVQENYISQNANSGILINGGTATSVLKNHITGNGITACDDNIKLQSGTGISIHQNLIESAASLGIDGVGYSGGVSITDNSITNSGLNGGNCAGRIEHVGIRLDGSNSTILENRIHHNSGAGIVLGGGNTNGNLISRNAIYANGNPGQALGIDLDPGNGMGNGVTVNDAGDADGGPNGASNFPVFSAIYATPTNLVFEGWCRPGVNLEFFISDITEGSASPGDNQLGRTMDYGEGQVFIGAAAEGSPADSDSRITTYTDLDGNTDTTNKFRISIPKPAGIIIGSRITATASILNTTSEFSPLGLVKIYTLITNRRITYRVNTN